MRSLASWLTRLESVVEFLIPGRQLASPPPLKLFAFSRERDFRQVFAQRRMVGLTVYGLERQVAAFAPRNRRVDIVQAACHEYTHCLLRRRTMNYPAWYDEGIASFLSTVSFTPSGQPVVGRIAHRWLATDDRGRIDVSRIVDRQHIVNWRRHDLPGFYERAWLLVHMLQLGGDAGLPAYGDDVPRMLALIDAGVPAEQAVEAALGVPLDVLQRQLRNYRRRRSLPERELALATQAAEVREVRCLDETEARLELAEAAVSKNPRYSRRLFERLLVDDPNHLGALVGLSRSGVAAERARQAVVKALAVDAGHAGANVRMAELKIAECRGRTTAECLEVWRAGAPYYRRALEEAPDSVRAAYGLGVVYVGTGRPAAAVDYLRLAHQRAPWEAGINYFLGEAYRLIGEPAPARIHLGKAMHWHPERLWRERAARALALLDD